MQYIKNPQDVLFKTINGTNYYITRNSSYIVDYENQFVLTRSPSEIIINYNSWNNVLVIAVKNNIVIGNGMIDILHCFYHRVATFYGLFVMPEYRNLGVGNELLQVRLEICKKMKNVGLIKVYTMLGCEFGYYSGKNLQKNGFVRTTNEYGETPNISITEKVHRWELVCI